MNAFSALFLAAVGGVLALRWWLLSRQLRTIAAAADTGPAAERAAAYARDRLRLRRVDDTVDSALLLGWTLLGGIAAVDAAWAALDLPAVATGTAVIASVVAATALVDLPLRAWRVFGIEQRHGFNRMGAGLFLADQLRAGLLAAVLGVPLVALALWLIHSGGSLWWLWLWLLWLAVNVAGLWLAPRWLAPLFQRYRPITDPLLRERLERLVRRCGFDVEGIYVVDGSRRSTHANAYFTGLGRNRRIVLYDTLLEQLGTRQIEAVLAHELGHFRLGHIGRRLALSALASLAGLLLLAALLDAPWFQAGLGVPRPSVHAGLLLFLLVAPLVTFFVKPFAAALSRRHEYEADAFAARHCPADDLMAALRVLYRENAAGLPSDPLYSLFHDSHPPAEPRLRRLRRLRGAHRAGGAPAPEPV